MTPEAAEIMEKLKDKKAEYEAIASSDSSVQLEDIDNRIIIEVLGPERYGRAQAEVQRLKDQMAQMLATTVEREKLRFKRNMKNSSYNLKQMRHREKQRLQRGKQNRAKSTTNSNSSFRI
ncbi:hypothetical protein Gotur_001424 [Gossypium turneri]